MCSAEKYSLVDVVIPNPDHPYWKEANLGAE